MANVRGSYQHLGSRREFMQAGVGLGVAGVMALGTVDALFAEEQEKWNPGRGASMIKPGDTILFKGDSITDAGRKKGDPEPNSQSALGNGYAWLAAMQMLVERPDANLKIFNRGISGHKV